MALAVLIPIAVVVGLTILVPSDRDLGGVPQQPVGNAANAQQGDASVAIAMEGLMLQAAPNMRGFLSMVDIANADRHLIVHFKPSYAQLDANDREVVERAIANLWRETKYVREENWSPDVEFIEHQADGTTKQSVASERPEPGLEPVAPAPPVKSEFRRRMEEAAERGRAIDEETRRREAAEAEAAKKREAETAEANRVKSLADAAAKLEARADSLLRSAKGLAKAGKTEAAIRVYKMVAEDFPGTPQAKEATNLLEAVRQ